MHTINITTYFEGYLWYSNGTSPKVYNKDTNMLLTLDDNDNPFVVEGFLFDIKKQTSYAIKYVDGRYFVYQHALQTEEEYTNETYIAHSQMEGVEALCFKRHWLRQTDALCCGMDVLQPAELIFVGFENH